MTVASVGRRPLIGIVADRKPVTSGAWIDIVNDGLPHTYIAAIERCGGDPVLFPCLPGYVEDPGRLLDLVDGLFLPGGRDLDASIFDEDPHEWNDVPFRLRDDLEIALVREAVRRDLPVLGACRGEQVINVAFHGTMEQHLADRLDLTPHRDVVGTFTSHPVRVLPGTRLAAVLADETFEIASHHHQAVGRLGSGLVANAIAPDGVVEGVEVPTATFCLGVQWHPEERDDAVTTELVTAFVDAARAGRAASCRDTPATIQQGVTS